MDPIALAISFSELRAAETALKAQYAVAAKVLKASRSQGEAAVDLIAAAGESFADALAAMQKAVDPRRVLDVYA